MTSITYFEDLQKRLGHHYKEDPTTYSLEELVKLGKALTAELDLIYYGKSHSMKQAQLLQDLEKLQTDGSFEEDKEVAKNLDDKTNGIGYMLVHVGADTKQQERQLREEMWFLYHELLKLPEKHEGKIKELWSEYALNVRRNIHYWNNETDTMVGWVHQLRDEFKKRQPGYKEKTLEEQMEEDGLLLSDEDFLRMVEEDGAADHNYTDHELEIMGLEDALHERDGSIMLLRSLYDRLERITLSDKELTDEQREEIERLRQSAREITSDKYINHTNWRTDDKENIRLLTQIAKPEGKSIVVLYTTKKGDKTTRNQHFLRNLILRYGIDLMDSKRDRLIFNCKRLAWANNYVGTIKGYEDKGEVIISLWVNGQNKGEGDVPDFESDDAWDYFFDAQTTLVARQHGDRYLELERKYAPFNADYRGYDRYDLMKAHKLIMGELLKG